jgi:hypothetical protein
MNANREVRFTLSRRCGGSETAAPPKDGVASVPRIARLMALAIRFEALVEERKIKDYAELARLGGVTRARMSQIMKLLHLAPDLQEQLLFLPAIEGLNERNLRAVVRRLDWSEQRRLFQGMIAAVAQKDQTFMRIPSCAQTSARE